MKGFASLIQTESQRQEKEQKLAEIRKRRTELVSRVYRVLGDYKDPEFAQEIKDFLAEAAEIDPLIDKRRGGYGVLRYYLFCSKEAPREKAKPNKYFQTYLGLIDLTNRLEESVDRKNGETWSFRIAPLRDLAINLVSSGYLRDFLVSNEADILSHLEKEGVKPPQYFKKILKLHNGHWAYAMRDYLLERWDKDDFSTCVWNYYASLLIPDSIVEAYREEDSEVFFDKVTEFQSDFALYHDEIINHKAEPKERFGILRECYKVSNDFISEVKEVLIRLVKPRKHSYAYG